MVFNQFIWDNYRQTSRGKAEIKSFRNLSEAFDEELVCQIKYSNKNIFSMFSPEAFFDALVFFQDVFKFIPREEISDIDHACDFYARLAETEIKDESGNVVMPAGDYQFLLQANTSLSYALNFLYPDYFFPNLYCFNFGEFVKLCDNYEDLDIPEIPKKSDYRARYNYYADMCRVLYGFRTKNGLTSEELCAFMYDFAPRTYIETKKQKELPKPLSVWCIGGGVDHPKGLWQCNEQTRRGDIILYYQKHPKSAITRILRAETDGLIDPFFHFYSRTHLGESIHIPDISLNDLKEDIYFSTHSLVKKNFQGVSGWPMTHADYRRIIEILSERGYDVSPLPTLPTVEFVSDHEIRVEKDVEEYLLNPYLAACGITEEDYLRQMPLHMGRGYVKYPDYAVFVDKKDGYETAKILIEAKLEIKNNKDREDAFKQARSYALRLQSEYIMLCDRNSVWIYEGADRVNYERYSWGEMRTSEIFARMKRLFSDMKTKR